MNSNQFNKILVVNPQNLVNNLVNNQEQNQEEQNQEEQNQEEQNQEENDEEEQNQEEQNQEENDEVGQQPNPVVNPGLQIQFSFNNGVNPPQLFNIPIGGNINQNLDIAGNNVENLINPGNVINQMINILNVPIDNTVTGPLQNQMNDVVTTLESDDLDNLEEYTLEEDTKDTCPITMTELKKGVKVVKLPCGHVFEATSIKEYLEKYSYKCPICRKECGKGHHHI